MVEYLSPQVFAVIALRQIFLSLLKYWKNEFAEDFKKLRSESAFPITFS
jgi:hypothetical protein